MSNIRKFINSVKENGGGSYNINTKVLNPKEGYSVSIQDREQKVKYLTELNIREYIDKNIRKLCLNNVYLGCWKHKGEYYLDCSEVFDDKREAIMKGIARNQIAIFDNEKGEEIFMPSTQGAGTMTQKQTYLNLKIQELLKN